MNIVYCGDKGIIRGVLVSILSLLMNGRKVYDAATREMVEKVGDDNGSIIDGNSDSDNDGNTIDDISGGFDAPIYNIFIVTIEHDKVTPFPLGVVKFLDDLIKKYNPESSVTLIDATEVFTANLPKKNMGSYFTPCSMLRLYINKIPELAKMDRVLYLDYDVVCRASIKDFYRTDLTDIEAAGVLDIYGKHFYRYHGWFKNEKGKRELRELPNNEISHGFLKQDYMNSGVMLFNVPKCLETRMFEEAVSLCVKKKMMLADQAALNKAITLRKLMPRKYNEQAERPRADTVLHHFSNNFKLWPYFRVQKVKPFEIDRIHDILKIHEYDDLLNKYKEVMCELSGE